MRFAAETSMTLHFLAAGWKSNNNNNNNKQQQQQQQQTTRQQVVHTDCWKKRPQQNQQNLQKGFNQKKVSTCVFSHRPLNQSNSHLTRTLTSSSHVPRKCSAKYLASEKVRPLQKKNEMFTPSLLLDLNVEKMSHTLTQCDRIRIRSFILYTWHGKIPEIMVWIYPV